MPHSTHALKAYCADAHKPLVFCELCGKEEDEGLNEPCAKTFYVENVDTKPNKTYPKFVSGLA